MSTYQTLDLAVKIGGNFGVLEDIADDLDTIHRKAQKVRHNTIGFDVDGDAESIARSEAVEQSLKDTAGTYDAEIETSGGFDASNQLSSILTDLGDLQGRTVELGRQLDFDESYVNESLDNIRENLRGETAASLSDADVRQFTTEIEEARSRYRRLGVELYADTSEFENDARNIRAQLERAVGMDDGTRTREMTRVQDLEVTYGTEVDPEELFDTLSDELESAQYEVAVTDVTSVADDQRRIQTEFEDTDVPSTFDDLRATVESGDLERALDTTQRLQQQFSELDRPALEQRMDTFSQTLERSVIEDGDVSLDDDFVQSQLGNLESQLYEIHPDVEIEPDVELDADAIDTDLFTNQLHSLGEELSRKQSFFADMGVDPEQTYNELGALHAQFIDDVESGDIDAESVADYNSELASLQDRLHQVSSVSRRVERATDSIEDLGDTIADYRVNKTDLTQPLEQGSFSNRIEEVDNNLKKIQHSVVKTLDPDATYSEDEGFQTDVALEDSDVYRRIMAMRTALAALDDTVSEPEVHLDTNGRLNALLDDDAQPFEDYELEQRLRTFQNIAEREGKLFAADDNARDIIDSLSDESDFTTTLGEQDVLSAERGDGSGGSVFDDLSASLQESFDAEEISFEPLQHDELGRSRPRELWDRIAHTLVGPENIVRARGENALSPQDFIGESFAPEDLIDGEFSAQDIFDYEGRELTDVFESERTFRAYMNPESDVSLKDAIRTDFSLIDIAPDSKGLREKLEAFGDVDMSTFYDAAAKAVPMLLTFVMALPAAIGGLIAVGGAAFAAAGALGAVGALSIGGLALSLGDGNLQKGLEEIRSQVVEDARSSFTPLASQFEDLGRDALDGVGAFFDRLAAEATVLTELEDEARAFGEWVYNEVPDAIDDVVALAQAFAPLFAQGGEWLATTDIVGAFVEQASKSVPVLLMILDAFLMMLPTIMKFSTGMLQATAVIFKFWSIIWGVIDALGPFAEYIGFAVGIGLSLYTTMLLLSWATGAFATVLGSTVVTALWSYIFALAQSVVMHTAFQGSLLRGVYTALVSAVGGIAATVGSLWTYITTMSAATVATYALAAAIAATGIGLLIVGVGMLGGAFLSTSGSIQDATKSLKDFEDMRSSMDGSGINNPYGPLEHGDMTAIDPNAPMKSGVQGDANATVNNTTVNNDNSTKIEVKDDGKNSTKDTQSLTQEISHQQFRDNEKSSKPY